jgi:Na+-transporting methylmalonyl-CoA/oxaloacetate decarboxylase gamma subunit
MLNQYGVGFVFSVFFLLFLVLVVESGGLVFSSSAASAMHAACASSLSRSASNSRSHMVAAGVLRISSSSACFLFLDSLSCSILSFVSSSSDVFNRLSYLRSQRTKKAK